MSNVSTFFGPTMPGTTTTPDLDTVMAVGNSTSYAYYGTGMGMGVTTVVGPAVYTPNDGDYTILCDCGGGNVRIDIDPSLPNMYYIKAIVVPAGNYVDVSAMSGGSIDFINPYRLTRENEGILVVKSGTTDYAIASSHYSRGTVNSGTHVDAAFSGSTITIPHQLNTIPDSVYVTAGENNAASLFASDYYVTVNATDITIELSAVSAGLPITIYWGVTKN